ncbi:MAG: SDR family NAD(P)-dependent oxidoreductase [Aestuariivita sp.]|nr:SDR family NAD(P)-dependent oxidoreductase [Aestuariivita sp.]
MKTALVTGANRGIGYAIAKGLCTDHRVFIGARDASAGRAAADTLGCESVYLDLELSESYTTALAQIGGVDVLVNNAGILLDTSLMEEPAPFHRTLQVMFLSVYELIRLCQDHMHSRGYGRIVNVSSGWGAFSDGLAGPGAYGVAKAALNALTHVLPRDLPNCIKINAMCPGWVHTRMGGPAAPRTPEEGADTALWLARLPSDGPSGGFFRDRKPISW